MVLIERISSSSSKKTVLTRSNLIMNCHARSAKLFGPAVMNLHELWKTSLLAVCALSCSTHNLLFVPRRKSLRHWPRN